MEQIQELVEFPVTIPNQRKVNQLIQISSIINIISSLSIGIITDSLKYLSYSFAIQFIILILLIAPNWLFKSEPSLEWITIKM